MLILSYYLESHKVQRCRHVKHISQLPEVIVHRFEEELAAGLLEDVFEVRQSDSVRGHRQLHQVGRLLLVQVVDNLGLPHLGQRLWRRGRQGASSRGPRRLPLGPRLPVALAAAVPWSSRWSSRWSCRWSCRWSPRWSPRWSLCAQSLVFTQTSGHRPNIWLVWLRSASGS